MVAGVRDPREFHVDNGPKFASRVFNQPVARLGAGRS
jgi:hypothetical protein